MKKFCYYQSSKMASACSSLGRNSSYVTPPKKSSLIVRDMRELPHYVDDKSDLDEEVQILDAVNNIGNMVESIYSLSSSPVQAPAFSPIQIALQNSPMIQSPIQNLNLSMIQNPYQIPVQSPAKHSSGSHDPQLSIEVLVNEAWKKMFPDNSAAQPEFLISSYSKKYANVYLTNPELYRTYFVYTCFKQSAGQRYLKLKTFQDYFKHINDFASLAAYEAMCDSSNYE